MRQLLAGLIAIMVSSPAFGGADEGKADFVQFCASCHGISAMGDGPMVPWLVRQPSDLTMLSRQNGGPFPADWVYFVVDGRRDVAAHGPREMPVWGMQFALPGAPLEDPTARARIYDLIDYLRSIQR